MRCFALSLALLAACGDDTTIVNNYGTTGTSSADGSGGGAGTGGDDGDGGDDAPASTASTASSGSTGSTSSASSGAGGDGAGGGAGGAGGGPEVCEAAPCPDPDGDYELVNCDPACGATHPICEDQCGATMGLYPGLRYVVRTPPVLEQNADCEGLCGAGSRVAWGLRFRLIEDACAQIVTPEGGLSLVDFADTSVCSATETTACVRHPGTGVDENIVGIGIARDRPVAGAVFSVVGGAPGLCEVAKECDTSCSGPAL